MPRFNVSLQAAYDRVGDLLGYSGAANLGDVAGALRTYEKALAIREVLAAANPNDASIQSELLNSYFHLSFVLMDAGDYSGGFEYACGKGSPWHKSSQSPMPIQSTRTFFAGFYWKTGGIP